MGSAIPAVASLDVALRSTLVMSLLFIACIVGLAAALRTPLSAVAPATLPLPLRADNIDRPEVHVFLRSSCRSCQSHQRALESALMDMPLSTQQSMRSRIHLWEIDKTASADPQRQPLPVAWRSVGIRVAPTTWFVSRQDSIETVWVGARSAGTWRSMLLCLQNTDGENP